LHIEQTNRVGFQLVILAREIYNSPKNSLQILHWKPEFVELLEFQLLLKQLFNNTSVRMQMSSSVLGCEVEEVIALNLVNRNDLHSCLLVIKARYTCNMLV
jgi:hypothetical protein